MKTSFFSSIAAAFPVMEKTQSKQESLVFLDSKAETMIEDVHVYFYQEHGIYQAVLEYNGVNLRLPFTESSAQSTYATSDLLFVNHGFVQTSKNKGSNDFLFASYRMHELINYLYDLLTVNGVDPYTIKKYLRQSFKLKWSGSLNAICDMNNFQN